MRKPEHTHGFDSTCVCQGCGIQLEFYLASLCPHPLLRDAWDRLALATVTGLRAAPSVRFPRLRPPAVWIHHTGADTWADMIGEIEISRGEGFPEIVHKLTLLAEERLPGAVLDEYERCRRRDAERAARRVQ